MDVLYKIPNFQSTYHIQYGGITSNNKRKGSEALNSVSNAHWKLFPQISGAPL